MSSKNSKFMFDKPFTSDWLFWVFTLFLAVNVFNGVANVQASGGLDFSSSFSILSGLIDGVFRILISWVMVSPIYWIRRIIRKSKST